ncbi:hypothetical protein ENBRE01_1201 [Enteropsectra breve]|nr:hypothetical protein ENBRE01_1201 [Enteropsectra breve]
MSSVFRYSQLLRLRLSDPKLTLESYESLSQPLVIQKAEIRSVTQLAACLYAINAEEEILISTAINNEMALLNMNYQAIILHRKYENIYFDLELMLTA